MKTGFALFIIALILAGGFLIYILSDGRDSMTGQASSEPNEAEKPRNEAVKAGPLIYEVEINKFRASPDEITLKVGDSIKWINRDIVKHWIYSGYYTGDPFTGIDSGFLDIGEEYTMQFNEAGEFIYRCKIFPYVRGKITVK